MTIRVVFVCTHCGSAVYAYDAMEPGITWPQYCPVCGAPLKRVTRVEIHADPRSVRIKRAALAVRRKLREWGVVVDA